MPAKKYLFFVALSACVWAQKDTGTISGTVRDVTGAVVPRASITVANAETNIAFRTVTGEDGGYTAPALRPGDYIVTAELAGFKKEVRRGVILQVNQVAVIDMTLQVGDVAEITEVREAASLIQTQSVILGDVIAEKQAKELPLNGRNFVQLITLAVGL